jgi:hypothetical protein
MQSTRCSCRILMELEFSRNIFEKFSNVRFHDDMSIWSRVVSCELTDRHDNNRSPAYFAKGPKISSASEIFNYRNTKSKLSLLSQ